jgi:hypothetical protein
MQFGGEVMRQIKVTRYVRGVMIFVNCRAGGSHPLIL